MFSQAYSVDEDPKTRILLQVRIYRRLGLVEMAISTNPKPTIYRSLYENMGPGKQAVTDDHRELLKFSKNPQDVWINNKSTTHWQESGISQEIWC